MFQITQEIPKHLKSSSQQFENFPVNKITVGEHLLREFSKLFFTVLCYKRSVKKHSVARIFQVV